MCVLQAVCRAYISTGFNYLKGAETCTLEVNAVGPCIMALDFLLVTKKRCFVCSPWHRRISHNLSLFNIPIMYVSKNIKLLTLRELSHICCWFFGLIWNHCHSKHKLPVRWWDCCYRKARSIKQSSIGDYVYVHISLVLIILV